MGFILFSIPPIVEDISGRADQTRGEDGGKWDGRLGMGGRAAAWDVKDDV